MKLMKDSMAIVLFLLFAITARVQAASYTYQTFDEPNAYVYPGYEGTRPGGINKNGQISGYYRTSLPPYYHGFIRSSDGTTYTPVDCSLSVCNGNGYSYGTGINSSSQVVGYCLGSSQSYHRGFVRSAGGTYTAVEDPSVQRTYANDGTNVNGINDYGQMVGYYTVTSPSHTYHGFFTKTDGTFVNVDYPSINGTLAFGINNSGTVIGYYSGGYGGYSAFYMTADGTYHGFEAPNTWATGYTQPMGINDNGEIAGSFNGADNKYHGFVRSADGAQYSTIDYPSATATYATGINNSGLVTGYYMDAFGTHGFIATPIIVLPVKVVGPPDTYYNTLILAYQSLLSGSTETIEAQTSPVFASLDLNNHVNLTLIGGYNSNFDVPPTGMTTIQGELIIESDILTVVNLTIQ